MKPTRPSKKQPSPKPPSAEALAWLAVAVQPPPAPAGGLEVAPWLFGWMAARGAPEEVVAVVRARVTFGRTKYGQPLRLDDGRDPLADAVQELGDALQYTARLAMLGADLSPLEPFLDELWELVTHRTPAGMSVR